MRKVVGSFDDRARLVIPSRGPWRIPWWSSIVVELDRTQMVVRGGSDEQLREPMTGVVGFSAGQWTPPQRRMAPPGPQWTVFVSLDDGRHVPFDVKLRDEAEATKWATTLDRALARIRAPKTYRE